MKKKIIGIIIAAVLISAAALCPTPKGLSREGLMALTLFLSSVIMWITESFPMSVTGLGMAMLMVLFKVYSLGDAMRTFAGTAFFFVFGTYAINACLTETTIPDRICAFFINLAKGNSRKFVLGMLVASAALSSIMSNMATCALLSTLSLKLLKINGVTEPGKSNLGKCLMIGIPFACGIGGFATPAGTPANVIAMNLLEDNLGITIRFLDWTLIGVPIAIVCLFVIFISVVTVFKPEPLTDDTRQYATDLTASLGKLSTKEIKTVIVIGVEIVLWFAGTWIPILSTTLVALICMLLMFLPGINVLDWKTYDKHANYDCLFMMGAITALVGGLTASGAAKWLVESLIPDMSTYPTAIIFIVASLLVAVFHMVIPAGSAVLTLASVPILGIAATTGASGAALMLIAAYWAGACYLLPFDGVPLLTYSTGYYKMTDMSKCGIIPYVTLIPGVALLIPLLCKLFGF